MFNTQKKNILIIVLAILFALITQVGFVSVKAAEPDNTYCGTGEGTSFTETISYTSTEVSTLLTTVPVPNYDTHMTNDCAPVAGAIIAGHFDYYCPNLIPEFTSVLLYNGAYYTSGPSAKIHAVISSLYSSMQTDASAGTTFANFKTGLTSYAQGQGYSASYTSVMSGSSFNLNNYITQIGNGRPVALFINTFKYIMSANFMTSNNTDTLIGVQSQQRHVCVGYGYKTIKYYNGSNNFRTDTYLMIALGNNSKGYLNINSTSIVENAIAVYIG